MTEVNPRCGGGQPAGVQSCGRAGRSLAVPVPQECWPTPSRGSAPEQAAHRARRTRRSSRMNPSGPALSSGRTLGRATASLVVAARSRSGPRLRDRARGAAGHRARLKSALEPPYISFVYYAHTKRKLAPGVVCHGPPLNFHCPVRLVPEYPIAGEHTPHALVHFRSGAILSVGLSIVSSASQQQAAAQQCPASSSSTAGPAAAPRT